MSIEVKRAFVLADKMKIVEDRYDEDFPYDLFESVSVAVDKLSESELNRIIVRDPVRLNAFDKLEWVLNETQEIGTIKVYDRMGGRDWAIGPVSEVAILVKSKENNGSRIWSMAKWAPIFAA